ncbi:MAG TPA: hypothetical protein VN931_12685, partial [Fibrobacteria bacterium]|nr:hypothetical protein [Fibrobacteria bacterium]
KARGRPGSVEVVDAAVAKDDAAEPGPGQAMDLALRFHYSEGPGLLVVLVEHWSSASKLDLLRTARYYLDLCRRFPEDEILPIALVDDDKPHDLENTILRGAYGYPYLIFETRLVQVPALDMQAYRSTCNRVALSFLPNMRGSRGVDSVLDVAGAFLRAKDPDGVRLLFAFWVVEGRLNVEQQWELNQRLKERDMPEIIDWWRQEGIEIGRTAGVEEGIEKGIRATKLEDARKMLAEGLGWDVITRITGIKRENLI